MNIQFGPDTDPNTLPYFITEVATGRRVQVRFAPLTESDEAELRSENWANSVFAPVWQHFIGVAQVFKLVEAEATESASILGLVRVGNYDPVTGRIIDSLLETASSSRFGGIQRYQGVGRVLVARLVAESLAQGGQGQVRVTPRPGSEAFYRRLGFVPVGVATPRLVLNTGEATQLMASCGPVNTTDVRQ